MIVLDDLLVRPFVGLLDVLHTLALNEAYDLEGIQDEIKELTLLYEIGEIDDDTYEQRKAALEEELAVAERVHEQLASGKIEVKS